MIKSLLNFQYVCGSMVGKGNHVSLKERKCRQPSLFHGSSEIRLASCHQFPQFQGRKYSLNRSCFGPVAGGGVLFFFSALLSGLPFLFLRSVLYLQLKSFLSLLPIFPWHNFVKLCGLSDYKPLKEAKATPTDQEAPVCFKHESRTIPLRLLDAFCLTVCEA